MRTTIISTLLATAILSALPACETFNSDNSSENSRNAHLGRLDGTWRLTHIDGQSVEVPSGAQNPTIVFNDNGNLTGNTGLNSMSGTYTTKSRYDNNITFSPIATTKMAGDQSAMDLERRYNDALTRVDTVRVDGDRLIMKDGDQQVLRFARSN